MNEKTIPGSPDFREQHRQYLQDCAQRRVAALKALPPQLSAFGVATVTARYSGCSDSGQFDEFSYLTAANADVSDAIPAKLHQQVENLLYDALEARHGGWEDNEGAEGEFRWTLANNHFEHLHKSFYTECYTTEQHGWEDLTELPAQEEP